MSESDNRGAPEEPGGTSSSPVQPAHVAIIMDGNGRWAEARGFSRARGHQQGAESVRAVTEECARRGLRELTLYAFSTENWRRPRMEIQALMRLLRRFLRKERDTIMENNIRLRAIGRLDDLFPQVRGDLEEMIALSDNNAGLTLRLALNYGGRAELVDATRAITADVAQGDLASEDIDHDTLRRYLYDPQMTDPDLLIRTAGEQRLSNFLLWQLSYTELYFTPVYWPDFREPELDQAFRAYATRRRRFGGLDKATETASRQRDGSRR